MAKRKKTSKDAPKRKSVRAKAKRPPTAKKSSLKGCSAWKSVFTLSEAIHTGAIDNIHRGIKLSNGGRKEFDFDHFLPTLRTTLAQNPECDAFVFGGSPESFDLPADENSLIIAGIHPVPVFNIILMSRGQKPPPFVAIRNFQQGTETIRPMESMNLAWTDSHAWITGELAGRVKTLACSTRMTKNSFKAQSECDLYQHEYATLFYMCPSAEWNTEKNDASKLSIRHAIFEYNVDGEDYSEEFDRDGTTMATFVPDFCERNDLDEDEHSEPVKAAIKAAFQKAREEKQAKVDLFDGYDPDVLESVRVVKIYPRNGFVTAQYKSPLVNEYYGKADVVV